jgi:hypothetical protein
LASWPTSCDTPSKRRAEHRDSIRRIVWVDDWPEGNRLEISELQQRFDVVAATSTEAGMDAILSSPEGTAVISDAVRQENGRQNLEAGKQLISHVDEEQPGVPVYIYCGPETAQRYGTELYQAGARLVTDSFAERADNPLGRPQALLQRDREHA